MPTEILCMIYGKIASNRKKVIELFKTVITISDICFSFQNWIILSAGYNDNATNHLFTFFDILHEQEF